MRKCLDLTLPENSSLLETPLHLFIQKIRKLNYSYYGNKGHCFGDSIVLRKVHLTMSKENRSGFRLPDNSSLAPRLLCDFAAFLESPFVVRTQWNRGISKKCPNSSGECVGWDLGVPRALHYPSSCPNLSSTPGSSPPCSTLPTTIPRKQKTKHSKCSSPSLSYKNFRVLTSWPGKELITTRLPNSCLISQQLAKQSSW